MFIMFFFHYCSYQLPCCIDIVICLFQNKMYMSIFSLTSIMSIESIKVQSQGTMRNKLCQVT